MMLLYETSLHVCKEERVLYHPLGSRNIAPVIVEVCSYQMQNICYIRPHSSKYCMHTAIFFSVPYTRLRSVYIGHLSMPYLGKFCRDKILHNLSNFSWPILITTEGLPSELPKISSLFASTVAICQNFPTCGNLYTARCHSPYALFHNLPL